MSRTSQNKVKDKAEDLEKINQFVDLRLKNRQYVKPQPEVEIKLSMSDLKKIKKQAAKNYQIRNYEPPNPLGFKDYKVPHFNNAFVGSPG